MNFNIKMIIAILSIGSFSKLIAGTCPSGISPNGHDIIVIAGQSNAVGSGVIGSNGYQNVHTSKDNLIFQYGRWADDNHKIISGSQKRLQHVPHDGYSNVNLGKKGFGIPFARLYARNSLCGSRKVLIVPVAKGSTSMMTWDNQIDQFMPVTSKGATRSLPDSRFLFSNMKQRITSALNRNSGNRLVAFLWQQGEADVLTMSGSQAWRLRSLYTNGTYDSATHADIFQTKLMGLKSSLRNDFGTQFVFLAGLVSEDWQYWHRSQTDQIVRGCRNIDGTKSIKIVNSRDRINTAIKAVASNGTKSGYVRTHHIKRNHSVFKANGDRADCGLGANIHFSATSLKNLARRYYRKYLQLTN